MIRAWAWIAAFLTSIALAAPAEYAHWKPRESKLAPLELKGYRCSVSRLSEYRAHCLKCEAEPGKTEPLTCSVCPIARDESIRPCKKIEAPEPINSEYQCRMASPVSAGFDVNDSAIECFKCPNSKTGRCTGCLFNLGSAAKDPQICAFFDPKTTEETPPYKNPN